MTVDTSYHYIARNKKQIICYLDEDSISFTVQAKNQLAKAYKFRFTEIDRIHLCLSDVSWHTIDIYFRDKTHIHLKSVTFFMERDGALKRPKTNDANTTVVQRDQAAYRNFVIELHKRVGLPEATNQIKFTHGNPWKKALILLVLLALAIVIPITWSFGHYRYFFVFGTSFLLLFLFNLNINFRKKYSPGAIPQKYLPQGHLKM